MVAIFALICSFFIPESPSFLISQGKFKEAKKVLERIAFVNGKKNLHINDFFKEEVL